MLKSVLIASAAMLAGIGAAQAQVPPDVAFDGYCDGMHFDKLPGGFVGGASTGCITDPLHGVKAKVSRQGLSNVVTAYGTASAGLTFIVREDGTWYIETADGTGTFINSGTWTAGTPLVKGMGRAAGQR